MLKPTLIACLVALYICAAKAGEFHTSEKGNNYYVERDLKVTWKDALYECTIRNMSLLTPDTEQKQLEISELSSSLNMWFFWTSGREIQDLKFIWISNGDILTYSNWWDGEPTRDSNDTHCIGLYLNQWNSYECSEKKNFICEENHIIKKKNHELDAMKVNQSAINNQLEDSNFTLSNDMRELNESRKKLECDKHIITQLDGLLKSHEKQSETMLNDKQREISDLKTENEQYLNQLSVAKAQIELNSKEIVMVREFNEIQLRLIEDKYKIYTGFVEGILQLFEKLQIPK